jgi:hypothetical protein
MEELYLQKSFKDEVEPIKGMNKDLINNFN